MSTLLFEPGPASDSEDTLPPPIKHPLPLDGFRIWCKPDQKGWSASGVRLRPDTARTEVEIPSSTDDRLFCLLLIECAAPALVQLP